MHGSIPGMQLNYILKDVKIINYQFQRQLIELTEEF